MLAICGSAQEYQQVLQHILALRQGAACDGLADKFQQMRLALDGAVDLRVAAGHIGAYGDEVFVGAVASQQLFALCTRRR